MAGAALGDGVTQPYPFGGPGQVSGHLQSLDLHGEVLTAGVQRAYLLYPLFQQRTDALSFRDLFGQSNHRLAVPPLRFNPIQIGLGKRISLVELHYKTDDIADAYGVHAV